MQKGEKNLVKVDMVKLDSYFKIKPTFIKIDVEGYEYEVLKGAKKILKTRPKLEIEIHTDDLPKYNTKVDEILKSIDLSNYNTWIKWDNYSAPKLYNGQKQIKNRVHLFAIPK